GLFHTPRDQPGPVGTEGRGCDEAAMALDHVRALPRLRVPELDRAIDILGQPDKRRGCGLSLDMLAAEGDGQRTPIRAERAAVEHQMSPGDRIPQLPAGRLPDVHSIPAECGQSAAIRTEGHVADFRIANGELVYQLAGRGVPD